MMNLLKKFQTIRAVTRNLKFQSTLVSSHQIKGARVYHNHSMEHGFLQLMILVFATKRVFQVDDNHVIAIASNDEIELDTTSTRMLLPLLGD